MDMAVPESIRLQFFEAELLQKDTIRVTVQMQLPYKDPHSTTISEFCKVKQLN